MKAQLINWKAQHLTNMETTNIIKPQKSKHRPEVYLNADLTTSLILMSTTSVVLSLCVNSLIYGDGTGFSTYLRDPIRIRTESEEYWKSTQKGKTSWTQMGREAYQMISAHNNDWIWRNSVNDAEFGPPDWTSPWSFADVQTPNEMERMAIKIKKEKC